MLCYGHDYVTARHSTRVYYGEFTFCFAQNITTCCHGDRLYAAVARCPDVEDSQWSDCSIDHPRVWGEWIQYLTPYHLLSPPYVLLHDPLLIPADSSTDSIVCTPLTKRTCRSLSTPNAIKRMLVVSKSNI